MPKNTVNLVAASMIREEDLADLETFKQEIQKRIDDTHGDGRIYMMQQYVRIQALVSSEVKRVRDRFDRESLAASRKAAKELKKAAKSSDNTAKEDH